MSIYIKKNGSWVLQDGRPHLKLEGIWTPLQAGYVKRSGIWKTFYVYDTTPPSAPILDVSEYNPIYQEGGEYKRGRYVKINVKATTSTALDPTVRRVRLLVSNSAQPATQYDTSSYIAGEDAIDPGEPWSEVYYNDYNGFSRVSSTNVGKYWTRNAVDSTVVPGGTYYFSAWAEDFAGNWSSATNKSITLKKNFDTTVVTTVSGRWDANNAGTWSQGSFSRGEQKQKANPVSRGVYFYNDQFAKLANANKAEIKSAQIFLHRKNDSGKDTANVYLFYHNYKDRDAMPVDPSFATAVKVGTIGKGEAKWFNIPESFYDNLVKGTAKGFGLNHKDPDKAAQDNDFSVMKALADAPRSGEVQITWTETA